MKKPNKQAAHRPRELLIPQLEHVRGGSEGTDSYGGKTVITSLRNDDPKQAR